MLNNDSIRGSTGEIVALTEAGKVKANIEHFPLGDVANVYKNCRRMR